MSDTVIKVENIAHDALSVLRSLRGRRRIERARIIQKRYSRVQRGSWHVKTPGHLAKNNTVCSCWMCGNPRKFFRKITRHEKIAFYMDSASTDDTTSMPNIRGEKLSS